ncbi:hypothetical protein vseg_010851 [Gypsophila vaccaria]
MASSIVLKSICAILVCMVMTVSHAEAVITCGTVSSTLGPCLPYLTGQGTLTKACCTAVSGLDNMASTTTDRQTACNCLKSAASQITNLNFDNAAALPSQCGVSIPYKISPSTDCSTVE